MSRNVEHVDKLFICSHEQLSLYLGKEFKALFISTVRTLNTCLIIENRNSDPAELDFGFLSDDRFLNTAVTRAQSLLAVVGDPLSLCSVGACRNLWKDYLQRCKAINGLRGCTLKTIMDFCLRSQVLDPSAHEFTPCQKVENPTEENLESVSSSATLDVSTENESNGSGSMTAETEPINGASSASCDSTSNAIATQNAQPVEVDDVQDGVRNDDEVGGIGVDEEDDLGVKERQDSEPSTAENGKTCTVQENRNILAVVVNTVIATAHLALNIYDSAHAFCWPGKLSATIHKDKTNSLHLKRHVLEIYLLFSSSVLIGITTQIGITTKTLLRRKTSQNWLKTLLS